MQDNTIKRFKDLTGFEDKLVGRKATRIAQLKKSRVSVPRGFVITNKEFFEYLQNNNLKEEINNIISNINFDDPLDIKEKSNLIKHKIYKGKIEDDFKAKLAKAYSKIGERKIGWLNTKNDVYVAIRCSVVCEDACALDIKKIEEEGGNLNIKGLDLLVANIKDCWGSLFSKEALTLAHKKKINLKKFSIAVIVQQMIDSKTSGILLTSKNENTPKVCVIEAVFGFGGRLILKENTPDHYETNKKFFNVVEEINRKQKWKLARIKGQTTKKEINKKKRDKKKLDKLALKDLTNAAKKIEAYFGVPQNVEWAINKKDIYILNSEPVNYDLEEKKGKKEEFQQKISGFKNKLILKGVPASKGIAKGIIKIINNKEDYKKVDENTIIFTKMTDNSMLDIIKRSKGVVTKEGSAICHAAIACQKLGKPCIVNIQDNNNIKKEGQRVQINGLKGEIHNVQEIITKKEKNSQLDNVRRKIFSKKNLDIRNIEKIDLKKIKSIEFPINYLFTDSEIENLKNRSKKEIIMKIRRKIEKIIKRI